MRNRSIITLIAMLVGLSTSFSAHAGLNFGWLTANPVEIGSDIDLGSAAVTSELTSGVQTITATTDGSVAGVRIDSIVITGDPGKSDYSGTCTPGMVLGGGSSCTIQYAVTSNSPGNFSEQINIGCSPVQAIGVTMVLCTDQSEHTFHNLLAEFFSATPVPTMSRQAFTMMCLLILVTGGYFGFRKN